MNTEVVFTWNSNGLLILLAAWAVLLFGGFIFGKETADHTRRMPMWTRMASSLVLVITAWIGWQFVQPTNIGGLSFALALGMTLGFLGDLFMAHLIPVGSDLIGGIAAFGLGHIAYIAGLLSYSAQTAVADSSLRWLLLIFWWAVGAIGWYVVVYRPARPKPTPLHYAALVYSLLLATTVGVACGVATQVSELVPLAVGTALFLLSDLILAAQLFSKLHFRLIGDIVWLTYGPAQMLIVFALPLHFLFR